MSKRAETAEEEITRLRAECDARQRRFNQLSENHKVAIENLADWKRKAEEAQALLRGWKNCIDNLVAEYGQGLQIDLQIHQGETYPTDAIGMIVHELKAKLDAWPMKIFTHKYLDPHCVESGCHSLAIAEAQVRGWKAGAEAMRKAILDKNYYCECGNRYVVGEITIEDMPIPEMPNELP